MGSGESKRVRVAQVETVPSELMDQVGAPAPGNERESVTVVRLPSLPGVEVWRAQRSQRYWRIYHEEIRVLHAGCELASRGQMALPRT